jgi:hypothetical protein
MAFFYDHFVSHGIRDLGYDVKSQTLAVGFPGHRTVYHSPVSYSMYAAIFHARFTEQVYHDSVEDRIPVVGYPEAS